VGIEEYHECATEAEERIIEAEAAEAKAKANEGPGWDLLRRATTGVKSKNGEGFSMVGVFDDADPAGARLLHFGRLGPVTNETRLVADAKLASKALLRLCAGARKTPSKRGNT
jgi:hypothetical protein